MDEIASAWGLSVQEAVQPERGTNNLVWFLNDSVVLRIYRNLTPARVAAEHQLQQFASAAHLRLTGSAQRLRPPGIEFTGSNQVGERAELPVRMQPKVARQRHRFGQQSSVP